MRRGRDDGFTLVELLVVVLIVGILAAIAVPVYLSVQRNARDVGVKSDLISEKTALVAFAGRYGDPPTTVSPAGVATLGATSVPLTPLGWARSEDSTASVAYTVSADLWCLDATGVSGAVFRVSSSTRIAAGTCAALATADW